MIRSMTGFARVEHEAASAGLVWELRSVNHRYLDIQFKLPEELRRLEPELRAAATARLARGKVEAALRLQLIPETAAALRLNQARLRALKQALDDITAIAHVSRDLDPLRLLAWPGVVIESAADPEALLTAARDGFDRALAALAAAREREGERLAAFIRERIATMRELVSTVRERAVSVRDAWAERLRARCVELGVEIEPTRLAQEVVLAAQRLDVDEEMSRLAAHLDEIETVLRRDEALGRRLDFLLQELNREANTLSSKSQDAQMTGAAVEMKVLIEQMREQVQNLE